MLDDVREAFEEVFGCVGMPELQEAMDDGVDLAAPALDEEHQPSDIDEEVAAVAAEIAGSSALPVPDVQALVAACHQADLGYISCPVGAWAEWPTIGRLTDWPKTKKVELRSVGVTCTIHKNGCKSPAKRRHEVDDEFLKTWLFSAELPGWDTPLKDVLEMKERHLQLFNAMLRERAEPAGSASGAASSSSALPV